MVAYTCNPGTQKVEAEWSLQIQVNMGYTKQVLVKAV